MVTSSPSNDVQYIPSPMFEERHGNRYSMLAFMSHEEQLTAFLRECNRRGARYRPGYRDFPNHQRLAMYCGCAPSTIFRLATGETQFANREHLNIINAIACICPVAIDGNVDGERQARMADAERWLLLDRDTRGDLWDTILAGIVERAGAGPR